MSERCNEQGACHAIWLEARRDRTDDLHKRHHEIQHGARGRIDVIGGLDEVPPDEDERRHERNADGDSVDGRAEVPDDHLTRQTHAEEERADRADKEKDADIPVPGALAIQKSVTNSILPKRVPISRTPFRTAACWSAGEHFIERS